MFYDPIFLGILLLRPNGTFSLREYRNEFKSFRLGKSKHQVHVLYRLTSTGNMISGGAALIVAVILAYFGRSLITVALSSSCAVLITQWLLALAGIG